MPPRSIAAPNNVYILNFLSPPTFPRSSDIKPQSRAVAQLILSSRVLHFPGLPLCGSTIFQGSSLGLVVVGYLAGYTLFHFQSIRAQEQPKYLLPGTPYSPAMGPTKSQLDWNTGQARFEPCWKQRYHSLSKSSFHFHWSLPFLFSTFVFIFQASCQKSLELRNYIVRILFIETRRTKTFFTSFILKNSVSQITRNTPLPWLSNLRFHYHRPPKVSLERDDERSQSTLTTRGISQTKPISTANHITTPLCRPFRRILPRELSRGSAIQPGEWSQRKKKIRFVQRADSKIPLSTDEADFAFKPGYDKSMSKMLGLRFFSQPGGRGGNLCSTGVGLRRARIGEEIEFAVVEILIGI